MSDSFELRVDKVRLRGDGRNTPALQDKYIVRSANGAYMAVCFDETTALKEVLRHMRMHYRRFMSGCDGKKPIISAIKERCERIPGVANDIRSYPVAVLQG